MFALLTIALLVPFGSTIVRREKTKNCVFIPDKGMMMTDHVISTYHVTSPLDCSFYCTSAEKCQSYNYKPRGASDQDVCMLNNATRKAAPASYKVDVDFVHYFDQTETYKSCLDYLREGITQNGIYTITDINGQPFQVYCDLTSEPRSAWTLIQSFALKNKLMHAFRKGSFASDLPLQESSPNWVAYRLSLARMHLVSTGSTHVRGTTSFEEFGVDYTDYVRVDTSSLDILSKVHLKGICKTVEYINIRGSFAGTNITVPFWQLVNIALHIDSSLGYCGIGAAKVGSVSSEDNFGYYGSVNPNFRGTKTQESTTQWWFGGYL